ncbi:MAG: SLC13 family permease [Tepidisphaeraceae bacterium]|jgi:Na+/H+ antiporter NhaD/arsenite permease-like protein
MAIKRPEITEILFQYGLYSPGRYRRTLLFVILMAATVAALVCARHVGILLDRSQIESLSIFIGMIWGILLFENHRLLMSVIAVAAVGGFRLMSIQQWIDSAGLSVLLFLLGTFLVAGYLEQTLFFEHLASQIVRRVGPRPIALMGSLMLAAMIASAVVGEVAAILFVGGAMIHIAQRYKLQAIPFLIMLVFATNTGSAASAFGPVGVTIAIKAHLTVANFFRWATPISLAVLGLVFVICRWWFARDWTAFSHAVHEDHAQGVVPDPVQERSFATAWILLGVMTLVLVFHEQIEKWFALTPDIMLLGGALGAGIVAVALSGRGAVEVVRRRVDWNTLAFFLMLFELVGAIEATGVTSAVARGLISFTGGRPALLALAVGWSTGFLSAFLANLLAVAAFLPIVAELRAHGAACPSCVYWLMLFGGTFMGNMTSIGSTCNIIACGMADRRGHGTIYFAPWLKIGLIISLASMALATALLALQTGGLSR